MRGLDLFTLNCVTIANMFLSAGAMYFVSRLNRRTDGIRECSIAGFTLAFGFVIGAVRTFIPSYFLNLVANLILFGGSFMLFEGLRTFRGLRRLSSAARFASWVGFAAFYSTFLYGIDDIRFRTAIASFAVGTVMLSCAWTMASHAEVRDRSVYWGTGFVYAAHGIVISLRAVHAFSGTPAPSIFASNLIDFLTVVTVNLSCITSAFGLSLATNLQLAREMEKLALYDPLTNLPNRRLFEERLAQAEHRAFETGRAVALLYCDVDDFKRINDTLGHEAGDQVLRVIAGRLREGVHESACLARVGGDEFVVLMEDAASRQALIVLSNALMKAVEGPIEVAGQSILPRMSCGLAVYPEDVGSASDLVRLADAAMYAMKQHGRDSLDTEVIAWSQSELLAD